MLTKSYLNRVVRSLRIVSGFMAVTSLFLLSAQASDYFFDWNIRNAVGVDSCTGLTTPYRQFIPLPHPDSDYLPDNQVYRNLFTTNQATGVPNGFTLLDASCSRDSLNVMLSYIPSLKFCLNDLESGCWEATVATVAQTIRSHSNPNINQAYIGNYECFPGATDLSVPYPWNGRDRSTASAFYMNSSNGFNVAMPASYPDSYYIVHTDPYIYGTTNSFGITPSLAPSNRAALFWAPLEHLSLAKRNLPAGHLLIPWVSAFIAEAWYDTTPPERSDVQALIQHFRLRGANGFAKFKALQVNEDGGSGRIGVVPTGSWILNYTEDQHRGDLLTAWAQLDTVCSGTQPRTILNLDTDKVSGVQWSGVRYVNAVSVLVSNLGNSATAVSLSTWSSVFHGVPAQTTSVAPGTHTRFTYTIDNLLFSTGSFDNSSMTGWYNAGGLVYDPAGVTTGCAKLQGRWFAGTSTVRVRTEPGANMVVSLKAKATNGGHLKIGYYYYDKNGACLGACGTPLDAYPLSTWTTYSSTFTVPTNLQVSAIGLILYNSDYSGSNTDDIVWLDDVALKFSN